MLGGRWGGGIQLFLEGGKSYGHHLCLRWHSERGAVLWGSKIICNVNVHIVPDLNENPWCFMHGLNMELDLQSLFWAPCAFCSCTNRLRPRNNPPPPAHIRGHYWSAKIEDISLLPLVLDFYFLRCNSDERTGWMFFQLVMSKHVGKSYHFWKLFPHRSKTLPILYLAVHIL
jgi:hypothetical protein